MERRAGLRGAYQASNLGRVRSLDRVIPILNRWGTLSMVRREGRVLKPAQNKGTGYWSVQLGAVNSNMLHRVIGVTFLPNPNNLPEINHKDGDRSNNKVNNLEWVSSSDNKYHSYRELERKQHGATIPVVLEKGDERHVFPSQLAAAKFLGVVAGSVKSAYSRNHLCRGYKVFDV